MGKSRVISFVHAETSHTNVHELDTRMNFLIYSNLKLIYMLAEYPKIQIYKLI